MLSKPELREIVRTRLDEIVAALNTALAGKGLDEIEHVVKRVGRGGQLPHWYERLKNDGTFPNLDGKSVGSVIEMLFVAVLEVHILKELDAPALRINPARGVDLPDFDLGIKCPSTNFCTSEPFFSAYERLYGNEYDCVVLLTDYQTAKQSGSLRLQVIKAQYAYGSEIADKKLCRIALAHRDWLVAQAEAFAQRLFRFLAYVNQSDWRAKQLLLMVERMQEGDAWYAKAIEAAKIDFAANNKKRSKKNQVAIPDSDLEAIVRIGAVSPSYMGLLNELDNWVTDILKDACRAPNDNEWTRLKTSPLNGKIGLSFALQWRYNFGQLFGKDVDGAAEDNGEPDSPGLFAGAA